MKTSKKLLALLLVFVLCVSAMAGCGKKEEADTPAATEGPAADTPAATEGPATDDTAEFDINDYTFALLLQNTWNPFFTEMEVGVNDALKSQGWTGGDVPVYDGNTDVAKQNNDLEDCIAAGYDVVFINVCDSTGIDAAAKKANDAGIILIALDTPLDDPTPLLCTVASDNYLAGELCADGLGAALDGKGELGAYLRSTSKVAGLRGSGFMDKVESDWPDMEIVNKQEGTAGSADAALPCMENILQGTPNITGQFALNDPSAQGCISAIKAAGKIDVIKVVAVDGSKEAKELVLAGEQLGSSAQFPGDMARYGVQYACQALQGDTAGIEKEMLIKVEWMDKSNAATMQNYDYDN